MATNYPNSIDNGTSLPYPNSTDDLSSPNLAAGQGNQNDAVIAVETLVGSNATQTTPTAQYNVLQATSATSSEWGLLTLKNVSGSTGTGDFVFATSPTISSPTISSPTISSPTITGSLGNISTGTITASGATTLNGGLTVFSSFTATGLVNYADLLSTIFSSQVTSFTNTGTAGGTFYYINLGGIKMLWGSFTQQSVGAASYFHAILSLPSGFFTTVTSITISSSDVNNTNQFSGCLDNPPLSSPTEINFYLQNDGGSTDAQAASLFLIGT